MEHRFVHIGDLHLGPGPKNADRLRALDAIIEAGCALPNLSGWLWPGDLNHGRMTIDDRNALAQRIVKMANAAEVVIVRGNHDMPGDLDIFARLHALYPVRVVTTAEIISVGLLHGGTRARIACLPYPDKATLVAAGVTRDDLIPAAAGALADIFDAFADELQAAARAGEISIFLGHINVAGAITSAGQPNIGRELELDASLLARLGHCYKGLNHIHKAQTIHGASYAGSVCRLDWGEVEQKSWNEIVYRAGGYDVVVHPIDVPPMVHVEGEYSRELGFRWHVVGGCDDASITFAFSGCEVRVRVRFKASERSVVDEARVREPFRNAMRLAVELIAVPDRDLRAPEVAAARTLRDKLRAWADTAGTPLSDSVLDKLARLEHGEATALLSELSAKLAVPEHQEVA